MRIAIISSPRCGNTFLRLTLSRILDIDSGAYHKPDDIPKNLPKNFILQIHWMPEKIFFGYLNSEKFKIITLSRHPLDIFVSVLRFSKFEKQVENWLSGSLEIVHEKFKKMDFSSDKFLDWCKSEYSKKLLDISFQWSKNEVIQIKYEDLIENTENVISGLLKLIDNEIEINPVKIRRSIEYYNLEYFKELPNSHGWKGKAGNWKNYINLKEGKKILKYHEQYCKRFNYT